MASERQPDVGRISAEAAALVEAVTRCLIRMRKNEYRAAAHVESASRTVYAVTQMNDLLAPLASGSQGVLREAKPVAATHIRSGMRRSIMVIWRANKIPSVAASMMSNSPARPLWRLAATRPAGDGESAPR
jgi:hypothetical protein